MWHSIYCQLSWPYTLSMLTLDKSTSIERISSLFSISVIVKLLGLFVLIRGTSALYKLIKFIWRENISNPLADLPGPPSPNWLYGNIQQIVDNDLSTIFERWTSEYGNTIKFQDLFGVSVLLVSQHTCWPILLRRRRDWLRWIWKRSIIYWWIVIHIIGLYGWESCSINPWAMVRSHGVRNIHLIRISPRSSRYWRLEAPRTGLYCCYHSSVVLTNSCSL